MTESTSPPNPKRSPRAGCSRTANALGLSDADLAYVLNVRPDTIRKNWKYGTQPIPDGVRTDRRSSSRSPTTAWTRSCPARRASWSYRRVLEPARRPRGAHGSRVRDHMVGPRRRSPPGLAGDLYIGNVLEVATAYDYLPPHAQAVHADPAVIALYTSRAASARPAP